MKKKTIALALVLVMAFGVTMGGTFAYLTSTDEVTNTFTVGKVSITLDETDVDLYGKLDGETRVKANEYKLIPGHTYTKDPIVHVTAGSEKCWLFVKVVDGIVDIQDTKTVAAQMQEKGWTLVTDETDVYYYESEVDALTAAVDVPVFDNFTIKGDAVVENYNGNTIKITAYAVQADGFDSAAAAWSAANFQ